MWSGLMMPLLLAMVMVGAPLDADAKLSAEQKIVAEAWRVTDRLFYDRSFNSKDWFALRQKYVRDTSYASRDEAYSAINSLLLQLDDKYTKFLTPDRYSAALNTFSDRAAGIGASVKASSPSSPSAADPPQLTLSSVPPSSPAGRAGLKAGDILVSINGESAKDVKEAEGMLKGPIGSTVLVRVREGAAGDERAVRIVREEGQAGELTCSVETKNGRKVGVMRIARFSENMGQELRSALDSFERDRVQGLVVDIRQNKGGSLTGGIEAARLFLPSGKTVVSVASNRGAKTDYASVQDGPAVKQPLVVLVDGLTASAAEVFAAAIKDNGRGVLVGEKTYGKGVVQTLQPLQNGAAGALAVTTARYETPSQTNIDGKGIEPDESITCPPESAAISCVPAKAFERS